METRKWPLALIQFCLAACVMVLIAPMAGCGFGVAAPQAEAAVAPRQAVTPTATPTSPTAAGGPYAFPLIPPGHALPTETQCAALVQRSSWEPRPDNAKANHTVPTSAQLAGVVAWNQARGVDPRADTFRQAITGDFTGTTDEILQWVACKWGVPVDIVRAEAVVESYWHQSQVGDYTTDQSRCPPGTWNGTGCYESWGILQVRLPYFRGTWPMIRDDTAFDAEYAYGVIRTCYEGWTTYLYGRQPLPGYPAYHAGDLWGCIGRWASGGWYDQRSLTYIAKVKTELARQRWKQPGF